MCIYSATSLSSTFSGGDRSIQHIPRQYFNDSSRRSAFSNHLLEQVLSAAESKVDLVLVNRDYALDFPGPTNPNVINIGGIAAQPASALTDDLESFMVSSGDHGVILFSLGTYSGSMPASLAELFAGVFSQLPQKVLWKLTGETPPNLGVNTRMMKWIPQNDILGHKKTKLFITHCGSNGMYEAVYHAVPMVFLPLAGDQPDNAVRGVARGLGVRLDIKDLTEKELLQSIKTVLYNDSFKANAVRASRIMLDQPQQPMERAVWWIEYVIRHGGLSHLRSKGGDMPLYQYLLLDVIGMMFVSCMTGVVVLMWACRFCFRRVSSKASKAKRE
ncbi:UDP-glucuronosyltransferase 2B7-like [Branchiostoma lanceolatum]|uniref:UDP-glucuronosyltransferase 2B7-like n=1 Tax=Branchiostoma lanceolatum TaxID=7740 RepID=UPI00345287FF